MAGPPDVADEENTYGFVYGADNEINRQMRRQEEAWLGKQGGVLSVVSAARPKIADYPFTTLTPNLGVVDLPGSRSFVMADIPGLIEGAHQGKGLGDQFLQHIERTKVLAYLVSVEAEDPQATYDQLRQEIRAFDAALADRPHLAVITKSDLLGPDGTSPNLEAPEAAGVVSISSVAHQGLDTLRR